MRRVGGWAVVLLAAAGFAGGCGGTTTAATESAPIEVTPAALAAELLGDTDDASAHQWEERRVRTCMDTEGHEYRPTRFRGVQESGTRTSWADREDRGFGISSPAPADDGVEPDDNTDLLTQMSASDRAAYLADLDACRERAAASLDERRADVASHLPPPVRTIMAAALDPSDQRSVAAMDGWRACMATSGFGTATDQSEMLEQLEAEWQTATAAGPQAQEAQRQRERAVAVADFDCDVATLKPFRDRIVAEIADQLQQHGVSSPYES